MDVEAIDSQKGWKVLEIDARFPSQTPICVYFSSGINLLLLLIESFENEKTFSENGILNSVNPKYIDAYCIFEHFQKENGKLISGGEHLISAGSDFHKFDDGTESGIEIFECSDDNEYSAYTVITYSKTESEAREKREKAKALILQ
jgi:hypothetical protein